METLADGKSNITETDCNDIKYSHMIRERFRMHVVTDTALKLRVPYKDGNFSLRHMTIRVARSTLS